MKATRAQVALILALFMSVPALAQPVVTGSETETDPGLSPPTTFRVLAGLRGYSDVAVEALVRLAGYPEALKRATEAVEAGRKPGVDQLDVAPEAREALETLSCAPETLLIAAAFPEELQMLRSLWLVSPESVTRQLDQVRRAYAHADREAAHTWQRALENDPVALGAYRDLLTDFCKEARDVAPDFACARVSDRRYYYACRPDEALIDYANRHSIPPSLSRALARWWSQCAPQRVDGEVEWTLALAAIDAPPADSVYDWPAAERVSMWQSTEQGDAAGTLGLVPVILQPPTDQPAPARLAWAATEHARLWGPPMPPLVVESSTAEPPIAEAVSPDIVIEEPIPGPQTAYYDDFPYAYVTDVETRYYVAPRYVDWYYDYPSYGYYYDPTYYCFRTSSWDLWDVCHYRNRYYVGGVYFRAGRLGWGAYGSCRSERTHRGDTRRHDRVFDSIRGWRDGRYAPPASAAKRGSGDVKHVDPPVRRSAVRGYTADRKRSVPSVRRSSPPEQKRTSQPGSRSISTTKRQGSSTRSPSIRSGSRPAQPSNRAIRSAPRSSSKTTRPSSGKVSGGSATNKRSGSTAKRR
jgi:hypothetical protein